MSWVDFFKEKIKEISQGIFPESAKNIKIIATISTDSVVASSFFIKTFQYLNYNFSCSFPKKITDQIINEIANDNSDIFLLINPQIQLSKLNAIKSKTIIIIESQSKEILNKEISTNLKIISPQQFDQNLEVPTSSLAFLLCREFCSQISDYAYLLPLPFFETDLEIPEQLLNEAIISKKLDVKKGITILSSQTLPIHKAVANTLCPYLPRISGSEDNAIQLLLENEIPVRENSKFKKLEDLNEEQTKRLLTTIMLKRLGSERNPELLLGNTYLLATENDDSIIKDLRSFHYLIQSCIAYSKPALALNICLIPKLKSKAYEYINNSQISIVKSMEFYITNKRSLTVDTTELSIIKMETELDYKFLNMFTKIINGSNFLSGKIIAVAMINPGGELLVQLEPSIPVYKEYIPKIIQELQKLMKFELEIANTTHTIFVSQDQEENLYNNLIIAAEAIKVNQNLSEPIAQ